MQPRHLPDPDRLLHFSEDPDIERFVPHVPATNPGQPPQVWAVDDLHAPLFWFPRDCPRITFWSGDETPVDALGPTTATRVHAIEEAWFDRVRTCELYVYRFDPGGFAPWSDADGYWVSADPQVPRGVDPVGDLLEHHRACGIELRVLPNLMPLRDAVLRSGYRFSMCRMANAAS
jgi:hypothetical protein